MNGRYREQARSYTGNGCFVRNTTTTIKIRGIPVAVDIEDSLSARFALRCSSFAERWFPDSWVFAALAVIIVALATLAMGAKPTDAAMAFGDGFWSLIPFTMQMAFVVIGGYVVASSPPAVKLIDRLARLPRNGRSAVAWVALISMVKGHLMGVTPPISGMVVLSIGVVTIW